MTNTELASRLSAFMRFEAPKLRRLSDYYRGVHEISRRRYEHGPQNRLVNNFCRGITDCTVGYFMGRGVSYEVSDPATAARLSAISKDNDEGYKNSVLARDLSVTGRAAELLWYEDGRFPRFTPLRVDSVFPLYDDGVEPRLIGAVRFYRKKSLPEAPATGFTVEYYDEEAVTVYDYDHGRLTETAKTPHLFGEVPVVFYENNRDAMGDFEPVLSLIDAYNTLESDSVNDFELFADSYLALTGMGGATAEEIRRAREDRVLLLSDGGDAKWLTKEVNDAYVEHLKSRIAKDIYRFSCTVDMAEEVLGGNDLSGVAIRWRLLNFENRVAVTEQHFRRGLARRLRLLSRISTLAGFPMDPASVTPIFRRNVPGSFEAAAEMAERLDGIVSKKTVLSHLPMVEDAEAELAQIQKEQKEQAKENEGKDSGV